MERFDCDTFCPRKNATPAFSNSSDLKSVFEKLRFHILNTYRPQFGFVFEENSVREIT